MHATTPPASGFKRQVVFRLSPDEWPLLERAAAEHGSIQAAVLAGLHALEAERPAADGDTPLEEQPISEASGAAAADEDEIRAREAAQILGLKASTVSGYIRSGRLPGRYDDTPGRMSWVTSRTAVESYRRRVQARTK